MTDHAQIIREELGWWLLRGQTEKLHHDKALAALDALEARIAAFAHASVAADRTAEFQTARASRLEAAGEMLRVQLDLCAEIAGERSNSLARAYDAWRAALGEDDPDPDAGSHPQEIVGSFEP